MRWTFQPKAKDPKMQIQINTDIDIDIDIDGHEA